MRGARTRLASIAALATLGAALSGAAPGASRAGPKPSVIGVCADPNNMPFSNAKREGFENKIAELVARDLHVRLTYDWMAQNRGFVRKTLKSGACDLIMGVPAHYDPVRTTVPYYRSTYVFLTRADRHLHITSFDDPRLTHLKIGIHVVGDDYENPPAAQALASRGIIDNVKAYKLVGDYSQPDPPARLIDAVARGDVDVAVVWGPFAGYFAPREPVKLTMTPVEPSVDASGQIFAWSIAMGVRKADTALADTLNAIIARERPAIRRILDAYGVPRAPEDSNAVSSSGR